MTDEESHLAKLFGTHGLGVLATIKRDGRPQLSNVAYAYDAAARTLSVSVTDSRAKTRNLRRDPRASMYVTSANRWAYAVAEGSAELTPVTTDPEDATAEALVQLYRSVSGEHPDWAEFRAAMVDELRLVLRVRVQRFYGVAG
ncbi:MAG: PPOX class F420-dependent oxidoreductase [Actinomycetota bacterium]|nr:PPOX class F420-dependent oxidoreductase [Actinomycetota bacterium]MDQ2852602.1 PPOX class F420-dependent oxidoreductase [Actinomycetota bacterium]